MFESMDIPNPIGGMLPDILTLFFCNIGFAKLGRD